MKIDVRKAIKESMARDSDMLKNPLTEKIETDEPVNKTEENKEPSKSLFPFKKKSLEESPAKVEEKSSDDKDESVSEKKISMPYKPLIGDDVSHQDRRHEDLKTEEVKPEPSNNVFKYDSETNDCFYKDNNERLEQPEDIGQDEPAKKNFLIPVVAVIVLLMVVTAGFFTVKTFMNGKPEVPDNASKEDIDTWANINKFDIEIIQVEGMKDRYYEKDGVIYYEEAIGVKVPNFVGLTTENATELASEKDLTIVFDRTYGDDIVKSQSILQGELTKDDITLVLRNAEDDIPNVTDEPIIDTPHVDSLGEFKVGDEVTLVANYYSSSKGGGEGHSLMMNHKVTIVEIHENDPYPFLVADGTHMVGFASAEGIKK